MKHLCSNSRVWSKLQDNEQTEAQAYDTRGHWAYLSNRTAVDCMTQWHKKKQWFSLSWLEV